MKFCAGRIILPRRFTAQKIADDGRRKALVCDHAVLNRMTQINPFFHELILTQIHPPDGERAKIEAVKSLQEILEQYRIDAFWDTPLDSIDPTIHKDFIIERLLQYGGMDGIRRMLANWGADPIRRVVMNSRNLSRMTATFWSVYFELPPESVRCLSESMLSPLK